MKKQLPASVVAIILIIAVVAVGAFYYLRFFKQDAPPPLSPEMARYEEIMIRTKGNASKMTPEEREWVRKMKQPGAAAGKQ